MFLNCFVGSFPRELSSAGYSLFFLVSSFFSSIFSSTPSFYCGVDGLTLFLLFVCHYGRMRTCHPILSLRTPLTDCPDGHSPSLRQRRSAKRGNLFSIIFMRFPRQGVYTPFLGMTARGCNGNIYPRNDIMQLSR